MTPDYWNKAKTHLSKQCPIMRTIIAGYPNAGMELKGDGFYTLLRAIVGQQISVKAADAVWRKLEAKCKPLTPESLARRRIATLRGCGLSEQKAGYAHNVAAFFAAKPRTPQYWAGLNDDEAIDVLVEIKGIGRWTAEMFLMFHLGRPDMWPVQDIGLLKALHMHYPELPDAKPVKYLKPQIYRDFSVRFEPYRSVATWYLWRSLDPVPVAY